MSASSTDAISPALSALTGGTTTHHTFADLGGLMREFWLHTPLRAIYRPPLVLMLHGWGERGSSYVGLDGWGARTGYGDHWKATAEAHGFLVAWPQGLATRMGNYSDSEPSWNAGGCAHVGAAACDARDVRSVYGGLICSDSCSVCRTCAWCACVDDVGFLVRLTRALLSSSLRVDASRYAATTPQPPCPAVRSPACVPPPQGVRGRMLQWRHDGL